ncbi:outer-membrane lipoprotein carrier protein LolA [Aureimonas mangrovi]|uniref:outer-membrane lipoprotein carrier protein LolA n=1 Tax=Aureimonas mangrovi TaxID=2758041 RepID=UPI00163D4CC7|nr:outer-membrane lipoprotein carrier protein LolA [Aureimonas mangrovi]
MKRPFHALFALALAAPLASAALAPLPAAAQQPAAATAQAVADHFSSVRSMTGNFLQFDAAGNQSEGTFSIERPGKIRFDYSGQPLRVIADGSQVAINNARLNTWDLYPLSQTPMKLLLDRRIDLSAANIQDVQQTPELITIVMGDRSVFGSSRITMMFDPNTYDLRQWTIRDQQGKDTTVIIDNVQEGVSVDQAQFAIPYNQISQQSRGRIGGGR